MDRSWARIAHRGASGSAPESTRAAIERALACGVDMIEVDVQLTRDGHPVIIHDDTLERTTTGTGPVRARTREELRHLDAGAWFAPEFAGEPILDLAELLALVGKRAALNLEIKAPADDWQRLLPRMLAEVGEAGVLATTVFSSFDAGALRSLRELSADARIGVLWYHPEFDAAMPLIRELEAATVHAFVGVASEMFLERARQQGVVTYVWTVNDPAVMVDLVRWEVGGIMSDHPELFPEVEALAASHAGARLA